MNKYGYLLIIFIFSCIDEFSLQSDIPDAQPVVEGLIADIPGDSFVRISSKLGLQGIQQDPSDLITRAEVSVQDGNGNDIVFVEVSSGLYRPLDHQFVGSPGESFTLYITLADGRSYRSHAETMNVGVQVDSVFADFKQTVVPNTEQLSGEHNFFITVAAPSNRNTLFRTQSFGIAQVAAVIDPSPGPCGSLCAEICYSYRRPINRKITLGNTDGSNQNRVTLKVATEPYDFHSRYFIEVKTYSLSKQGYEFWTGLANQQDIEGTIFDPQLAEVTGTNIFQVSNNEPIIGYFGASQINSDSLLINRSQTAGFVTSIPVTRTSCLDVWRDATYDVPPQFQ